MNLDIGSQRNGRKLNSWKEIAGFFGCDERTVKRWENERGLPVRRLPNGSRSGVFAYEDELRAWLHQSAGGDVAAAAELPDTSAAAHTRPRFPWLGIAAGIALSGAVLLAAVGLLRTANTSDGRAANSAATAVHHPGAEARAFYREGLYAWQTRTPVGLSHAVDDFTQAIVHDPQYAQAYAGLASCYNLLREYTTMAPDYAFPRARAAAERAIALDPSLADAHASLAFVDFYWSRDVTAARREFARAIALAPANATAHHWYATFLMTIRAFPDALAEIEKAETLDPESTAVRADKGLMLFYAGHTDEAIDGLRQLEQTAPLFSSPHRYLAVIYRAGGSDAAYLRELAASADARHDETDKAIATSGAKGLSAGGHAGMLNAMLATQLGLYADGSQSAYALAQTYALLGDRQHALEYLRTSLTRRENANVDIATEPAFRPLREDATFRAMVNTALSPAAATLSSR